METVRPAEVGHMVLGPDGRHMRFIIDHVLEPFPVVKPTPADLLAEMAAARYATPSTFDVGSLLQVAAGI